MSNQFINFTYNPVRDGFNLNTWRQLFGDPAVIGNQLSLDAAAIIHYGDILRCDVTFGVSMGAPVAGDDRKIGLVLYNKNAYAYFKIDGAVLSAETSDGTNTDSVVIAWNASWTNTNTDFRVKWESGTATFFINGVWQAAINSISVTGDPLSLYVTSDASNALLLSYIVVKNVQSFVMSQGNSNSVFGLSVKEHDHLRISENIKVLLTSFVNKADTLNISTNFTKTGPLLNVNNSDTVNISEEITVLKDILDILPVADDIQISEEVTSESTQLGDVEVGDDIQTSEEVTSESTQLGDVEVGDDIQTSENFVNTGLLTLNTGDDLDVSEEVTLLKDELDILPIDDTLNISETVTTFKDELDIPAAGDDLDLTENNTVSEPA